MNELLDQAVQECEGLAAEADAFGEELAAAVADVTDLERETQTRSERGLRALSETLQQLEDHDRAIVQRVDDQRAELERVDAEMDRSRDVARDALAQVEETIDQLREEQERVADEVRRGAELGPEAVEALEEALSAAEEETEEQLQEAEEAVDRLEQAVRDAVEEFREAEGTLGEHFERAEAELEELTEDLEEACDGVVAQAEEAALEFRRALDGHVEQTLEVLARAFTREVPQALDEGVQALGQGLESAQAATADESVRMQLELQALMQRYSQAMLMISNLMKTMHDTQMAAIRAMKA
jgi:DNA repair exonuclease SbcCD ATPase subunit